jgi:hypothetical protein
LYDCGAYSPCLPFGGERDDAVSRAFLPFLGVGQNSIQVEIPLGRLLLARLANLFNDFVLAAR